MGTILIVEDDKSTQRLYEMILEKSGHQVIGTAYNGEEAVKLYRTILDKPDIILMDYRMPFKDGIETTKEILQLDINNHSKIIFLSADESIKKKALLIGAISFLKKPLKINNLLNEIEMGLKASNVDLYRERFI